MQTRRKIEQVGEVVVEWVLELTKAGKIEWKWELDSPNSSYVTKIGGVDIYLDQKGWLTIGYGYHFDVGKDGLKTVEECISLRREEAQLKELSTVFEALRRMGLIKVICTNGKNST